MSVSWSFSAHVPAPPDAVFAWVSDFREDDHARPAFLRGAGMKAPAGRRRIVAREGNVVTLEDGMGRRAFRTRATVDAAAREVRVEGAHGYRATWRAAPEGDGTRLTCEGALAPDGLLRLFVPLFAKGMLRQVRADFDGHVADAVESLAR